MVIVIVCIVYTLVSFTHVVPLLSYKTHASVKICIVESCATEHSSQMYCLQSGNNSAAYCEIEIIQVLDLTLRLHW